MSFELFEEVIQHLPGIPLLHHLSLQQGDDFLPHFWVINAFSCLQRSLFSGFLIRFCIDIRAMCQKYLNHFLFCRKIAYGFMKWGVAVIVLSIYVRAFSSKRLHRLPPIGSTYEGVM